jgi:actin-related protein 8
MKRDEQILPYRLQQEVNTAKMIRKAKDVDRARAMAGNGELPLPPTGEGEFGEEEIGTAERNGFDASKVVVIHPGSQNLRIGLASDALPKSIPMVLAAKWVSTESEDSEPLPKRQKVDDDTELAPEQLFGEEFSKKFIKQCNELKVDMRANKRKVLPNSKELVINYNRRTPAETIPEHNDPMRIEWTDISKDNPDDIASVITGHDALRIPDDSNPKYRLFWPIQHGWMNEEGYDGVAHLREDIDILLEHAIKKELGLTRMSDWKDLSCVFVIPDLYDKKYAEYILDLFIREYGFKRICFIQETLAASFGAGYTNACIVDVGAQKTSICCVEDGMCMEDSRVNLKYGGNDVTDTFIRMMLHDHFPYADINLRRRYDFLLAEELKTKYCTMNQAEISVQLYDFHLRAPNQPTHKYQFKTYDEVILAPMGFYDPTIFDNSRKLIGRRKLIDRSYNTYDPDLPDDPMSAAQSAILNLVKPTPSTNGNASAVSNGDVSTPVKEKSQPFDLLGRMHGDHGNATPSAAGSPGPDGSGTPAPNGNTGTPVPNGVFQFGGSGTPAPNGVFVDPNHRSAKAIAIERDSVLPIAPLDTAILQSITHGAKGDEKKIRDLFGSIMVIGGGSKTPGFCPFLEDKLKMLRPDLADRILVGTSPRDMDAQVVGWKGASVFGQLTSTNDAWIGQLEYERLNSRILYYKCMWNY